LSFLVYDEDIDKIFEDGWETVDSFGDDVSRGYVVGCDGIFFVTFAGTVSPLSDQRGVLQWLAHLDFRQTDYDGGRVHARWLQLAKQIMPQVIQILDGHTIEKLFVCGHSYGGVLATLSRKMLADEGYSPDGIYTFGCPRVGNHQWAANQPVNTIFRVERATDIITMTPLSLSANQLLHEWMAFVSDGMDIFWQGLSTQYSRAGTLIWLEGRQSRPVRIDSLEVEQQIQDRRLARLILTITGDKEHWWEPVTDHDIWAYRSQFQVH